MLSCREATRLLSERCERPLDLRERAALRLHLMVCSGCSRFGRQVDVMRGALRSFRDRDEPAAPRDETDVPRK